MALGTSCFPRSRADDGRHRRLYRPSLWDAFTAFVDESYGAKPRIEYSRCGGAPVGT